MEARAAKAGFDNYSDYLGADRKNFVDVDPQNGEMVLRKIGSPHDSIRQRFQKAGRSFAKVRVTPEAIVELLKDYPVVIDKFTAMLAAQAQKPGAYTPHSQAQPAIK